MQDDNIMSPIIPSLGLIHLSRLESIRSYLWRNAQKSKEKPHGALCNAFCPSNYSVGISHRVDGVATSVLMWGVGDAFTTLDERRLGHNTVTVPLLSYVL